MRPLGKKAIGEATRRLRRAAAPFVGQLRKAWKSAGRRQPPPDHEPPQLCLDLRGWCDGHPTSAVEVIHAARRLERAPPRTIEPDVDEVFDRYLEVEAPDHVLASVPGARLTGNGIVFLPDGSIVGDVVTHLSEFRPLILADEPAYTHPLPQARTVPGDLYPLVIGNFSNYFHWLLDLMVRMPLVLPRLPPDTRFVVLPDLQDYHRRTLDLLGIGPHRLVTLRPGEVWECERLHFPAPYLKPILHDGALMAPFIAHCQSAFARPPATGRRRIVVSRHRDHHWRTTNEAEVMAALAPLGFERFDLADLTFGEQVSLFSTVDALVGTGAGLTNMIFMPRGGVVVQLQDPDYPVGHHFTVARAMGHEYWYLNADAVPAPSSRFGRGHLSVPVDRLVQTVDQALGTG